MTLSSRRAAGWVMRADGLSSVRQASISRRASASVRVNHKTCADVDRPLALFSALTPVLRYWCTIRPCPGRSAGGLGGGMRTDSRTLWSPPRNYLSLDLVAGAVFHVTGPGGYATGVTDNGTADEDSTVGSVCFSGVAPGEYTVTETAPPTGYGSGTAVEGTATAANGTDCGSNKPSTAQTAILTDPPLGNRSHGHRLWVGRGELLDRLHLGRHSGGYRLRDRRRSNVRPTRRTNPVARYVCLHCCGPQAIEVLGPDPRAPR